MKSSTTQRSFVAYLAIITLAITTSARADTNNDPITIGVQTTLTGDMGGAGKDVMNALAFANKRFFQSRYKFIVEDDQCSAKGGITVAKRFTAVEKLPYVLGVACNESLLAAAPVYREANTVVVATLATTGDQKSVGNNIFRLFPSDEQAAETLFKYVSTQHKHVAIYTEQNEYSEMMDRTFQRLNKSLENPLVTERASWAPHMYDHRVALARLLARNPEGVFVNANGDLGYIEVVKQLRSLQFEGIIYSAYWAASEVTRAALGELNNGAVLVNAPLLETVLTHEGKLLYQDFITEYGKPNSIQLGIVTAVDSLRFLDRAISGVQSHGENQRISKYLHSEQLPGMLGNIAFDSNGEVQGIQFQMQTIQQQQAEVLKSVNSLE